MNTIANARHPKPSNATIGDIGKGVWNLPLAVIGVFIAVIVISLAVLLFFVAIVDSAPTLGEFLIGVLIVSSVLAVLFLIRRTIKKRP